MEYILNTPGDTRHCRYSFAVHGESLLLLHVRETRRPHLPLLHH